MAAEGEEAIPSEVPELNSIVVSADQRANLVIRLLNKITVVGIPENRHGLNIYRVSQKKLGLAETDCTTILYMKTERKICLFYSK